MWHRPPTQTDHHNWVQVLQVTLMLTKMRNEVEIKAYCLDKLVWLAVRMYVSTLNLLTMSNSASFLKVEYASSYPLERR